MFNYINNIINTFNIKGGLPSDICGYYNADMQCAVPPHCNRLHVCFRCKQNHRVGLCPNLLEKDETSK